MAEQPESSYDAIIVGAGISGLWLGSRLQKINKKILIIEKSPGVGGRLATRRSAAGAFDHGAQFLKLPSQDPHFEPESLASLPQEASLWFSEKGFNYYNFKGGMTQWPKIQARTLPIHKAERVTHIYEKTKGLEISSDKGLIYTADKLYLTCPLPQSLSTLTDSRISFPNELQNILYAKALVGLFELHPESYSEPSFKYCQDVNPHIFSISDQRSKGITPVPAFTVVMTPLWSEANFENSDDQILDAITTEFIQLLRDLNPLAPISVTSAQLKKWRYSHPLKTYNKAFEEVGVNKNIILLGDVFGGPSVIGAIRSADAVPIFS